MGVGAVHDMAGANDASRRCQCVPESVWGLPSVIFDICDWCIRFDPQLVGVFDL